MSSRIVTATMVSRPTGTNRKGRSASSTIFSAAADLGPWTGARTRSPRQSNLHVPQIPDADGSPDLPTIAGGSSELMHGGFAFFPSQQDATKSGCRPNHYPAPRRKAANRITEFTYAYPFLKLQLVRQ